MPRKPKTPPVELPAIPAELLEQFRNGQMTAEAINAATLALKKALIDLRCQARRVTNQCNGKGAKTVLT